MYVACKARSRPALRATLILLVTAAALPLQLPAQQAAPEQAPAPVVRVRPRPQTVTPGTAPPDAAPLIHTTPRPKPVYPQALGGSAAPARSAPAATPLPHAAVSPSSSTAPATRAARPPASAAGTPARASAAPAAAPARPALAGTGLNRTVIVLDPGHGGVDSGSRIGDNTVEKTVTLAFAFRLRSLLTARGFTVVLTREGDTNTEPGSGNNPLTLDDRAGIANHSRAAACLLIHATGRGNGVHLYTSELAATPGETAAPPWLTAQAAWIPASQQLERSVSTALGRSRIALVSSTASVRPVDSLACPALVLELAPETDDARSINDAGYQDRIAAALAGALLFWQNQVQAPPRLTPPSTTPHTPRRRTAPAASSASEVRP